MLCQTKIQQYITSILGGFALLTAVVTFFFAAYNCYNYLWKKRISKHLIILFYCFTFGCSISLGITDTRYMLRCEFDHLEISERVSYIALVGIYYTVGLSMLQLSLSIRVMLNQLTADQAQFRNRILFITVYGALILMGTITIALNKNDTDYPIQSLIMLSLGLLVVIFDGFALIYVTKTLSQFGDIHLYKTIKSIKR